LSLSTPTIFQQPSDLSSEVAVTANFLTVQAAEHVGSRLIVLIESFQIFFPLFAIQL
jgi:hypothetical protein